jgi:hypothetical protein
LILPSDVLSPTTNAVGWFNCPAPALAEWFAGYLGKPGDWAVRPVSAPTFVELCRLVAAEPDVEAELAREIPDVTHLLIPFGGWTAYLNSSRWGTHVQRYPSQVAEDLRCRTIRAVAARRGGASDTILDLFEADGGGACRRSIYAGAPTYPETNDERLPFEEPQPWVPGKRNRERFGRKLLERYLGELGVPIHEQPQLDAALLIEFVGVHDPVADAIAAREAHLVLHPALRPELLLGGGLSVGDAIALVAARRVGGGRITGLEGYTGAEWWAVPPEQRHPQLTVDLSLLEPAASVKEAEWQLRQSAEDGYLWCVYGEAT